jgi:hypothetical protein
MNQQIGAGEKSAPIDSTFAHGSDTDQEDGRRPPMTEIIVNARERSVRGDTVSFEQIVRIAFPHNDPPPGQPFVYSMTYRRAASVPHAGELGPGGVVTVKKGTIFNVTRTVQS